MDQAELDLLRRALALRKQRKIGVLWADSGRYWISDLPGASVDPYGARRRISLLELQQCIDTAEQQKISPNIEKKAAEISKKRLA